MRNEIRMGKQMKKEINYQLWIRRSALFIIDIICIALSSFFALATRFEFIVYSIPEEHWKALGKYVPVFIGITLIVFSIFRLYTSMWEYAGIQEVYNVVWACIVSGILQLGIVVISKGFLPRSYYILSTMYLLIFTCAMRFSYRIIRMKRQRRHLPWKTRRNVMLIGAGEGAMTLLTEMQTSRHLERNVRCIIDDDPEKIGRHLRGVKIVGDRYTIKKNV
ncbi:MAG: nucleoside-diphosphate sugar epimerase/dehydratase, partial [Dorea sp.]